MKDKFLIGELAKLFNISTDTLRHYDKIDLLKPECDTNNSYRYYSITSFFKLMRILFLKSLDISLKDIKDYMNSKNINTLINMLKNKENEIDIKITRLKNLKNKINSKLEILEDAKSELNEIKIKKFPARVGVFLEMNDIHDDFEIVQAFLKNEDYMKHSSWLIEGQIYTSLSKEDMEKGILDRFRYFIDVITLESNPLKQVKMIAESDYACIAFQESYKDMGKHYKLLIQWIHKNGYQIAGDSIEKRVVDLGLSSSEHEYISEIQIPIKKSTAEEP